MPDVRAGREIRHTHHVFAEPLLIRGRGSQPGLQLAVVDDFAGFGVHQEHPARLDPSLADDALGRDVQHAGL